MALKGRIFIDNMRLRAYHGVMEQERVVGNDYVVSLRVEYPVGEALVSDDVNDTLSYAELAAIVRSEMSKSSALVEHVAGRIVTVIAERYPLVSYIYIKVCKIAPPMSVDCDGAGIEIEWTPGS